jgi:hypothetical protein
MADRLADKIADRFLFSTLSHVQGGILGTLTQPFFYGASCDKWAHEPTLIPDPTLIYKAGMQGWIDDNTARLACAMNGVAYAPDTAGQVPVKLFDGKGKVICTLPSMQSGLWAGIMRSMLSLPGEGKIMDAYVRGILTENQAKWRLKRYGANVEHWFSMYPSWQSAPGEGTIIDGWIRGLLDNDDYESLMRRAGADLNWFAKVPHLYYSRVSPGVLNEAVNRGYISPADWSGGIDRSGYGASFDKSVWDRMRSIMPGPGEITRMAARFGFHATFASALGLYDDQPADYRRQMDRAGCHEDLGMPIAADGVARNATWKDIYWAQSRRGLSVGEAMRMYHRLRPEEMVNVNKFVPGAKPFGLDELDMWLEYNDIPSSVRSNLTETGFIPLSLREIRMTVKLGVKSKEWVVARLQDQGHRKDRAEDLYDIIFAQEQWRRNNGIRSLIEGGPAVAAREVLASYEEGTIDADGATTNLAQLGFKNEPIALQLAIVDSRVTRKIVRAGVTSVKRDYVNGTLNAEEATVQLVAMGVAGKRIQQHLAMWTLQRSRTRRTATTAQLLSYVTEGLEDEATAAVRLANLGWDKPDIVLMLARIKGKMSQIKAKQLQAAEKAALAKAKALAQAQKQAQDLVKRLQADNRRATPRATLDKWLCDGIISEGYYLYRMTVMGYPASQAKRYLDDAKRKKACAPADESETQGEQAADAGLPAPDGGQQPEPL